MARKRYSDEDALRTTVPQLGTYMDSYMSTTASLRISESPSTGTFFASVCASVRGGKVHHPAARTYIYLFTYIDMALTVLTTISCLFGHLSELRKCP